VVREGNHIIMRRDTTLGTAEVLALPNHRRIKGSTLRRACLQARVSREDFLQAFERS
jgi:hypothetical protein